MMLTDDGLSSAEELRLAMTPVTALELAASDPQAAEAKVALGLETRAQPDGSPACGWCGRSNPPGGLADESLGGPQVAACRDGQDCARTRAEREPQWIDAQHPGWRERWQRVLDHEQQTYGGTPGPRQGNWQLSDPSPLELAALAQVRDMVERRAADWLATSGPEPPLQLAAPPVHGQPAPPPVVSSGYWGHTLRNPAHRTHTLGHKVTHRGPCTQTCLTTDAEPAPEPASARTVARRRAARRLRARG